MRSHRHLYAEIASFSALFQAAQKARKGKRHKDYVAHFHVNLEAELLRLERELLYRTYTPGLYTEFVTFQRITW